MKEKKYDYGELCRRVVALDGEKEGFVRREEGFVAQVEELKKELAIYR